MLIPFRQSPVTYVSRSRPHQGSQQQAPEQGDLTEIMAHTYGLVIASPS